jgi:hypothetical protein
LPEKKRKAGWIYSTSGFSFYQPVYVLEIHVSLANDGGTA